MILNFPAVCPCWGGCCISSPPCELANAGCWLLKKPLIAILEAAKFIVDKSRGTLNIAIGILTAAQGVVTAAKKTLDLAIEALKGVRKLYRVGVNALNAIAKFTLTEVINIREMYFKVALSVANGGEFQCRVKGVLVGNDINLNLRLNIRNPLELAKSLGEKAISGLKKFFG